VPRLVAQGGLDLIAKLRDKRPNMRFVLQNAASNVTRLGMATGAGQQTVCCWPVF